MTGDADQALVDAAIRFLFHQRGELSSGREAIDRLRSEFPNISGEQIERALTAVNEFWSAEVSRRVHQMAAGLEHDQNPNRHARRRAKAVMRP